MGIPVVFHFIVRTTGESTSNQRPPVHGKHLYWGNNALPKWFTGELAGTKWGLPAFYQFRLVWLSLDGVQANLKYRSLFNGWQTYYVLKTNKLHTHTNKRTSCSKFALASMSLYTVSAILGLFKIFSPCWFETFCCLTSKLKKPILCWVTEY